MKIRILAAVIAAFFMLPAFVVEAGASAGDNGSYIDILAIKDSGGYSAPEANGEDNGVANGTAVSGIIDITPRPEDDEPCDIPDTDNGVDTDDEYCLPVAELPPSDLPPPPPEDTGQTLRPFTPPGTGEVLDNATSGDGKEFFTIVTPDENVFYLIIDRQRGTQNVYFLNAVTEADLMSLATTTEQPAPPPVVEPPPVIVVPEPEPVPEPPAPESGGGTSVLPILLLAIAAGGAGWYFKVYRPKQQQGGGAGEYDDEGYGDFDQYEDDDENSLPDYDGADWESEDTGPDGDGEDK